MECPDRRRSRAAAGVALVLVTLAGAPALATQPVYVVGNYPVEASADDAVAAKERALADGRQAAFRSLLKRLVPVTAYGRLAGVRNAAAAGMIDGVVVRSERTSATQYIASLDFSFQVEAVRDLLRREGIPYLDVQAPQVVVVPVYLAPAAGQGPVPAELSPPRGSRMWAEAWAGLDLEHTLTPVKLEQLKPEVGSQVVQALREGDGAALESLGRAYASERVLLAVAEPDLAARKLNVTLAGRDAAGAFVIKRAYRLAMEDAGYAAELAAVVALGTIEGRWKAVGIRSAAGGSSPQAGGLRRVQMLVEFRNMQQWQEMHRQLMRLPGLDGLEIGGLTARSADVVARYPGGAEALADALAAGGFEVRPVGEGLQVRPAL